MNRHVLLAAGVAALVGGITGFSCTTPQPAAECGFQGVPSVAGSNYWAQYTLVDAGTGGSCAAYEGDRIDFQRYSPPGANMTFAALSRRYGRISRRDPCTSSYDGKYFRVDPSDPTFQKESIRATLAASFPDKAGYCSSTGEIVPSLQAFPEVTLSMCLDAGVKSWQDDGGWGTAGAPENTFPIAATTIGDTWSNFRMLSTARFVQNIWEADVTVRRDACVASYHVTGVFPTVGCSTDADCDPNPDLAAGRATGSGLSPDFAPKCVAFKNPDGYEASYLGTTGVCMPTVSMDELAKLK